MGARHQCRRHSVPLLCHADLDAGAPDRNGAGMHGPERIYPCPEGSGGGSARSIMPLLLNEAPRLTGDARQSLRVSLSISS